MYPKDRVIIEDISNGLEWYKIPVINDIDDTKPSEFGYITISDKTEKIKNLEDAEEKERKNEKIPLGCGCADNVCDPSTCICEQTSTIVFNRYDRLVVYPQLIDFFEDKYVECNYDCACRGRCNRKIIKQNKVQKKVFIKYFKDKGFGIVANQSIAVGMPVMEYTGVVMNYVDAETSTSSYQLTALLLEDDQITIDAKHYANVARFINHSCTPNLSIIRVYSKIPGRNEVSPLPRIALIAIRPIKKGDELTFSYDVNYFAIHQIPCLCYECICFVPPEDYMDHRKKTEEWKKEMEKSEIYVREHYNETKDVEPVIYDID